MTIFMIACCHGNSLQYTHMNEKEALGVLPILKANTRGLKPKVDQVVHFQLLVVLQVKISLIL